MAIYDVRCPSGHRYEVIQSFSAALPACRECGQQTSKIPSRFGLGGQAAASLPPSHDRMPQTWRGTYRGDRDYVTSLRRQAEARQRLEERHPELAGDRRPVLAHEGRYEHAPLRAGDPVPGSPPAASTASQGHPHPHPH